jgi:dCTP deaminase
VILGGKAIRRAFDEGYWKAFDENGQIGTDHLKIGPNSVDVTLSNTFMWLDASSKSGEIDVYNEGDVTPTSEQRESILLDPDDFVLGATRERFDCGSALPFMDALIPNLGWKQDIDGRSTMGRLGIACHITAGYGDFGFDRFWVLEIRNMSKYKVRLHAGMRIAQVTFNAVFGPDIYVGAYAEQAGPKAPVLGRDRFQVKERGHKTKPQIGFIERT